MIINLFMDCLRKALSADGEIEYLAIDATDLVRESMLKTQAWPPAMIHLGHALMGSALIMSITSKEGSSKVGLQWNVRGPFGNLFAEANSLGHCRGTILNPQAPVQNLQSTLGTGNLKVFRISKGTVTGIVESEGRVCGDLLQYLRQSEQRSCAMNLWVNLAWDDESPDNPVQVLNAYGYLVELLPTKEGRLSRAKVIFWEDRLKELGSLSQWEIQGDPTQSILRTLSSESEPNEILYQGVSFKCTCNEERAARALALAKNDLASNKEFVKSGDGLETLRCEFCGQEYKISD